MSVVPITSSGEPVRMEAVDVDKSVAGEKAAVGPTESSPDRSELALANENPSSNVQDSNKSGGYKVVEESSNAAHVHPKGYANIFVGNRNRRKSRIKYSGYGEEYAIHQPLHYVAV